MAEMSARDLRRLEALERRFGTAEDARKALLAERRKLRAAVTAGARDLRAVQKQAASAEKRLEAMLRENAALASRLDEATTDLEHVRSASRELRARLDADVAELEQARAALDDVQRELEAVRTDRDRLEEGLKLANQQLAGKSITPVVPAKEVARHVERLVGQLGSSLPELAVRDGELRLHVAFGKVGQTSGFVVPSAESPPEVRESMHELTLRFDRIVEPREQ